MRALLMKDFYVLNKQLRLYLLILVVFIAFNREFSSIFLPVWCSMLPYTSIAYDEQSKWDNLAAMMPYSVRDLVLSKYVFGWLCVVVITLIMMAVQIGLSLAGLSGRPDFTIVLMGLSISVFVMSFSLPPVFRFGVERGRMLMFLLIFLVCGGAGGMTFLLKEFPFSFTALIMGAPALALAATIISIPLSMKFYTRRRQ